MRRKNLICTAGLIFLLILLHGMEIPLKTSVLSSAFEKNPEELHRIEGHILKIEHTESGGYKMEVRLERIDEKKLYRNEKILVWYDGASADESSSDLQMLCLCHISFNGSFTVPTPRRNPGCFDYRRYLMSQNIFYETETDEITVLKDRWYFLRKPERWLIQQRFRFMDVLGDNSAGLVSGMLFGDTSRLDESVYEDFRKNGTAHVLAVSGLHIGILYSIYKRIFGHRQTLWSVICLALFLYTYGTLSMWSPSMCRASLMIVLHETAKLLDLRYDMITGLCTSAILLILQNPYCVFGSGFQMSFLAIISICFLTKVLPRKLPDGMTAGIAVNLGLLLYQMYQFNYISFLSVLINIPLIYLTGILVPLAMLVFVVYSLTGCIPVVLQLLLDSYCSFTVGVNSISTLNGWGSMDVVSPPLWMVVCGYFLLFYLTSEQNLIYMSRGRYRTVIGILGTGILCCIIITSFFYCPVSDSDVVFADVGQGDCIHIRAGNKNMLIDGGGRMQYNVGKNVLKPYLLKNGVSNLNLALATHTHMDHYKGLEELKEVYPVKELKTGMVAGDTVRMSETVWVETLWPLEIDPVHGQEENSTCSVFMIHYGNWKILITGDLDVEGENAMIDYYEKQAKLEMLNADVLKIGHHGSRTSTGDRFLELVSPQAAVIQVGENNTYGHPSQIIVEKCRKKDIILIRNDYNGGIGFSFMKDYFRIDTVL